MHLPGWWSWWYLWSFFKFITPIMISIVALSLVLKDRRPQLVLRARKGEWLVMRKVNDVGEVVIQGVVEIYNLSARANAIRSYRFFCERSNGWQEMEWEMYENSESGSATVIHNHTPLTLAPYSGVEAKVEAFVTMSRPVEMKVKIVVEDIFGRSHSVVVAATRG